MARRKNITLLQSIRHTVRRVADPSQFFSLNRDRYLQIARQLTVQVLQAQRPTDQSAESWTRSVEEFASYITAILITNPNGLRISQAGKKAAMTAQGDDREPEITYEDVWEWVNTEKDLTPDDTNNRPGGRGRSLEHITATIWQGINQASFGSGFGATDFSGVRQRILDWISRETTNNSLEPFLQSVLDSWFLHFRTQFTDDYSKYVDHQLRRI